MKGFKACEPEFRICWHVIRSSAFLCWREHCQIFVTSLSCFLFVFMSVGIYCWNGHHKLFSIVSYFDEFHFNPGNRLFTNPSNTVNIFFDFNLHKSKTKRQWSTTYNQYTKVQTTKRDMTCEIFKFKEINHRVIAYTCCSSCWTVMACWWMMVHLPINCLAWINSSSIDEANSDTVWWRHCMCCWLRFVDW